jgi:hypothetical protein
MKIQAISKKNQKQVNRALGWLEKYNEANELRDIADGNGDEKEYKRLDILCARLFDMYLTIVDELPKREKANIEKLIYY